MFNAEERLQHTLDLYVPPKWQDDFVLRAICYMIDSLQHPCAVNEHLFLESQVVLPGVGLNDPPAPVWVHEQLHENCLQRIRLRIIHLEDLERAPLGGLFMELIEDGTIAYDAGGYYLWESDEKNED